MKAKGGSDSKDEKASGRLANAVTMFLKRAITSFHVKRLEGRTCLRFT
jgi:hypothetical protein